jgi:hypothetical protein
VQVEPEVRLKLKLSQFLDQCVEESAPMLAPDEVLKLRQNHVNTTGGPPPAEERPTTEQLSCLKYKLQLGRSPFADFAVFGPYGNRMAKLRKFVAHMFIEGELVTKQIRGPANLESWLASWRVFRAAMLMLAEASPAALDLYERGIRNLVTVHGEAFWATILIADETVRSEQWEILRENADGEGRRETDMVYAKRPWNTLIAMSTFGATTNELTHWWYLHVTAPIAKSQQRPTPLVIDEVEGLQAGSAASAAQFAIGDRKPRGGHKRQRALK